MLKKVGLWALAGFAVALMWALVFYLAGPSMGRYPSQGAVLEYLARTPLLRVSAPVALVGRHYAITWYWSAVLNAAVYACIGLIAESIRMAVRSSRVRLNH